MLKINITHFVNAVQEAPSFAFPEMNEGTTYLFKNIFCRLSSDEDVLLSELDLDAFDVEDIHTLRDLYDNVLAMCNYKVNGIMNALQRTAPVCKAAAYV